MDGPQDVGSGSSRRIIGTQPNPIEFRVETARSGQPKEKLLNAVDKLKRTQ